jgi:hypothetical protein
MRKATEKASARAVVPSKLALTISLSKPKTLESSVKSESAELRFNMELKAFDINPVYKEYCKSNSPAAGGLILVACHWWL